MCRLARITRWWPGLEDWLRQLQRSYGGDGNGVASGGKCLKGLNVTNRKIAKRIKRSRLPSLYHTRWCSSGWRCSFLCHPFRCGGGWLAHNGTWYEGAKTAEQWSKESGQPWSDTLVMAAVMDRLGFAEAMERRNPSGVWLWQNYKGELHVHKRFGQLWHSPALDAWGSEPPAGEPGDWYEVADGDYGPGDVPAEAPPRPLVVWTPAAEYATPAGHWWSDRKTTNRLLPTVPEDCWRQKEKIEREYDWSAFELKT